MSKRWYKMISIRLKNRADLSVNTSVPYMTLNKGYIKILILISRVLIYSFLINFDALISILAL